MAIPADPNDGSLLSSVFLSSDNEAYRAARDLWAMTGLPAPQTGEFHTGANADRVYMNAHGLCFSFVYRRIHVFNALAGLFGADAIAAPVFEGRHLLDDRILQPLLQVDLSRNCCFEIVPGVQRVGVDKKTVKSLARELKGDDIDFYNPEPEYVGQMRVPGEDQPLHVIVNRRSVKPISYAALGRGMVGAGYQDAVYGGLREQFTQSWNSGSGEAFETALQECARIAALPANDGHKILHDHWNGQGPASYRRSQIAASAGQYALKLAS